MDPRSSTRATFQYLREWTPIYQLHHVWTLSPVKSSFGRPSMVRLLYSPPTLQLTNLRRKIPWRISRHQKARQRARLRHVDKVVSIVDQALSKKGITTKVTERWKAEMPTEPEMRPKDKYTMFARYAKNYRKGIHSKLCYPLSAWLLDC
jgi:hypothetical protein